MNNAQVIVQTVNTDGELLNTVSVGKSYRTQDEDGYIKVYLKDILDLQGIFNADATILLALIKEMNYKNIIHLSSVLRKEIIENLGIAAVTLTKALEKYVDQEVLARLGRGVYQVNPFFFGKGTWKDILELRITVDYKKSGKTITSTIKTRKAKN